MPSDRLIKYGAVQTLTMNFNGIAAGAGITSGLFDNTTTRYSGFRVFWRAKTHSVAPAAGAPYRLYLVPRSNDGTIDMAPNQISATASTAVSVEPTQAVCLGSLNCPATANFVVEGAFDFDGDLPAKFSFVGWNATAQQTNATLGTDFTLEVTPYTYEQQ